MNVQIEKNYLSTMSTKNIFYIFLIFACAPPPPWAQTYNLYNVHKCFIEKKIFKNIGPFMLFPV